MVESVSVSGGKQELSEDARLCLIQTLNALPRTQFDELIFALKPPSGNIPPSESASQSSRSMALLEWAESPIGPGLLKVEKLLSKIISTHAKTAEQYLAFVISGKINSSTADELQAFVKLLRKKTGDDSIDIAFFEEGSIKVVLSGSPEGLAKLQGLFESGEMDQLGTFPVEAVVPMDSKSQAARKARLIQALHFQYRPRDIVLGLAHDLDLARDLAIDLARDLDRDLAIVHDLTTTRVLDLAITRAIARVRDLAIAIAIARDLDLDLSGADLSGANLRNMNLIGVDLAGADLTYADVTGTLFGNNPGLTDADKRDLQSRGAIFQDPPSSDVPALVRR